VKSIFFKVELKDGFINSVVVGDGNDIGFYFFYFLECVGKSCEDDFVGDSKFFDEVKSFFFRKAIVGGWSPGGGVSCDGNNEGISEFFGLGEVVDMSCVDAVEGAKCHHDFFHECG